MKTILSALVLLFTICSVSYAQKVLPGRDKSGTKIWITYGFKKSDYDLKETDTSLTLITHNKYRPIEIHCSIDKTSRYGKCVSEKINFDCDSCYQKIFKVMLDKKRFHWKLIDTNRYLSKISRKLLLAGNTEGHYFTLSILNVSDEEYKKMLTITN
ncbi:hypothetical protein ACFGVR_00910 [Mucilaginibacter sp. AW1-3]